MTDHTEELTPVLIQFEKSFESFKKMYDPAEQEMMEELSQKDQAKAMAYARINNETHREELAKKAMMSGQKGKPAIPEKPPVVVDNNPAPAPAPAPAKSKEVAAEAPTYAAAPTSPETTTVTAPEPKAKPVTEPEMELSPTERDIQVIRNGYLALHPDAKDVPSDIFEHQQVWLNRERKKRQQKYYMDYARENGITVDEIPNEKKAELYKKANEDVWNEYEAARKKHHDTLDRLSGKPPTKKRIINGATTALTGLLSAAAIGSKVASGGMDILRNILRSALRPSANGIGNLEVAVDSIASDVDLIGNALAEAGGKIGEWNNDKTVKEFDNKVKIAMLEEIGKLGYTKASDMQLEDMMEFAENIEDRIGGIAQEAQKYAGTPVGNAIFTKIRAAANVATQAALRRRKDARQESKRLTQRGLGIRMDKKERDWNEFRVLSPNVKRNISSFDDSTYTDMLDEDGKAYSNALQTLIPLVKTVINAGPNATEDDKAIEVAKHVHDGSGRALSEEYGKFRPYRAVQLIGEDGKPLYDRDGSPVLKTVVTVGVSQKFKDLAYEAISMMPPENQEPYLRALANLDTYEQKASDLLMPEIADIKSGMSAKNYAKKSSMVMENVADDIIKDVNEDLSEEKELGKSQSWLIRLMNEAVAPILFKDGELRKDQFIKDGLIFSMDSANSQFRTRAIEDLMKHLTSTDSILIKRSIDSKVESARKSREMGIEAGIDFTDAEMEYMLSELALKHLAETQFLLEGNDKPELKKVFSELIENGTLSQEVISSDRDAIKRILDDRMGWHAMRSAHNLDLISSIADLVTPNTEEASNFPMVASVVDPVRFSYDDRTDIARMIINEVAGHEVLPLSYKDITRNDLKKVSDRINDDRFMLKLENMLNRFGLSKEGISDANEYRGEVEIAKHTTDGFQNERFLAARNRYGSSLERKIRLMGGGGEENWEEMTKDKPLMNDLKAYAEGEVQMLIAKLRQLGRDDPDALKEVYAELEEKFGIEGGGEGVRAILDHLRDRIDTPDTGYGYEEEIVGDLLRLVAFRNSEETDPKKRLIEALAVASELNTNLTYGIEDKV